MGVRQRREPTYAKRPELLDPLVVGAAVANPPLAADLGTGVVELRPHLALHRLGQEVGVHVEEPRKAEVLPEGAGGLDRLDHHEGVSHRSFHALEAAAEGLLLLPVGLPLGE